MSIKVERASVHCESSDHELYKSLVSGGARNPLEVPFESMLEAFVAFACLGYHHSQYIPLNRSQEMTLSSYVDQDLDLFVLAALAYARLRTEDPDRSIEDTVTVLTTTKTII